jgi:hypothetical protein
VLAGITGLMTAALFFYLQRSELAWLHDEISLAVTREMQGMPTPSDANSLADGLDIGNSWSQWSRYKFGISFLAVSAAEFALALFFADIAIDLGSRRWALASIPFLVAAIFDIRLRYVLNQRDERAAKAHPAKPGGEKEVKNIRAAKQRKLRSAMTVKSREQSKAGGSTTPPA